MKGGETLRSLYDSLLEGDPKLRQIKAEIMMKAKQEAVVEAVAVRFPALLQLAQQQIVLVTELEILSLLHRQVVTAPDEKATRWLLNTITA
jgi:hypothetical protein